MNKNISSPTAARIFSEWEKLGRSERPRTYLGASIIGKECDMYLWLNFRGVVRENFDGRMYRLFDRGKREEAVFCADLRRIGCEVKEFDDNGNQFAVSALGGHFSGHLDGLCRGLAEAPKQWFVTEFKTHSDSSFKKLCKDGVAKAKPEHYAQMQSYMGHTGLKKALYMAVNKDNDDLWCEIVDFVQAHFDAIMSRAKHIIDTVDPDRCSSRPDDFRCKSCPCSSLCWHTAKQFVDPSIPETCRTCCHSTADTEHEGACWVCNLGHSCTTEGRCDDYLILPVFVNGDVVEGNDDGILYRYGKNGSCGEIKIGRSGFSVSEAKKIGSEEIDTIKLVKDAVPDSTVVSSNTLEMKYAKDHWSHFNGSLDNLQKWLDMNPFADWSKPNRTESIAGIDYFEYDGSYLVAIDKKNKVAVVKTDVPF